MARWSDWRWILADLGFNFFGFAPLGFAIAWGRGRRGILEAAALGVTVSFGIEMLQPWIPGRDSALLDWLSNGAGALFGGVIARAMHVRAGKQDGDSAAA